MEGPKKTIQSGLRTGEIILRLRERAERIYKTNPKLSDLLILAADRLDELEERVAIMSEPVNPTERDLSFPPDDEQGGEHNQ